MASTVGKKRIGRSVDFDPQGDDEGMSRCTGEVRSHKRHCISHLCHQEENEDVNDTTHNRATWNVVSSIRGDVVRMMAERDATAQAEESAHRNVLPTTQHRVASDGSDNHPIPEVEAHASVDRTFGSVHDRNLIHAVFQFKPHEHGDDDRAWVPVEEVVVEGGYQYSTTTKSLKKWFGKLLNRMSNPLIGCKHPELCMELVEYCKSLLHKTLAMRGFLSGIVENHDVGTRRGRRVLTRQAQANAPLRNPHVNGNHAAAPKEAQPAAATQPLTSIQRLEHDEFMAFSQHLRELYQMRTRKDEET